MLGYVMSLVTVTYLYFCNVDIEKKKIRNI